MKAWDTARMLAGACIIYGLVSACSGASAGPAFADTTSSGTGAGGGASCECAPKVPDVAVETCDKVLNSVGDNQPRNYAQHAYPGSTAVELHDVIALGKASGTYAPQFAPEGATMATRPTFLQDGMVTVLCGSPDDVVTFVRP